MVMLVFSVGAWLLPGVESRVGFGCRRMPGVHRSNGAVEGGLKTQARKRRLVNLLNGVASDLERAVEEVDSCLESDSQMAQERQK